MKIALRLFGTVLILAGCLTVGVDRADYDTGLLLIILGFIAGLDAALIEIRERLP
ncbi:hypothetical protein V6U71_21635 [Sphingopyxis sp. J-6]|uniref:hypothetical protein n=1 Tax=Sphingopyxis sp. J-6 TaxID=3122054 RepID=UPI003983E7DE